MYVSIYKKKYVTSSYGIKMHKPGRKTLKCAHALREV